jgi:hypothetical protein
MREVLGSKPGYVYHRLLGLPSPWGFALLLSGRFSHRLVAEIIDSHQDSQERLHGVVGGMFGGAHRPVDAAGETRRVTVVRDGQISLVERFIVRAPGLRLLDKAP